MGEGGDWVTDGVRVTVWDTVNDELGVAVDWVKDFDLDPVDVMFIVGVPENVPLDDRVVEAVCEGLWVRDRDPVFWHVGLEVLLLLMLADADNVADGDSDAVQVELGDSDNGDSDKVPLGDADLLQVWVDCVC